MRFRSTVVAVLGLATFAACSDRAPITAARSASGDSGANLARIASVSVTLASASVAAGSTTQATANVRDVYGNSSSPSISWKSSNTAVATVSSTGVVKGVAAGSATISANVSTYYGTKSGSAALTVTAAGTTPPGATPPPSGTTAPGAVTTLAANGTGPSSVTLTFTQVNDGAGAAAKYDVRFSEAPLAWGSGASVTNGTCATPLAGTGTSGSLSCTVLGLSAGKSYAFQLIAFRGTLNVDAKFGALSNVASATTPASGGSQIPTTISVSPSAASLAVGASQTLSASVKDQSGSSMTCSALAWTSQNTSVATVSAAGAVKGIAAGSATVTAACGSINAKATITVTAASAVVTSVSVSPATASIAKGATQALAATVKDQNGATMAGQAITWTSSAPSIASVSTSGVVTGVAAGSATITASSGGKSGAASITVTAVAPPPPPPSSGKVDTVFYEGFEANSFSQFQDGYNSQTQHIIADGGAFAGNRYLDVTYTPGQDAGWLTRFFMPGYDSLYVRMRVRFTPGFNGGTKIFGFKGSRTDDQWSAYGNAGICPNGTDRFAAMVVVDAASNRSGYTAPISMYSYWPEMARESDGACWGRRGDGNEHYYAPLDMSTGTWHLVEFWVKLNTIGQHDALQQLWIDGRLAADWAGQSFRTSAILKLNSLTLTFSSSPTQVQHMYMDEILVAKQKPTP